MQQTADPAYSTGATPSRNGWGWVMAAGIVLLVAGICALAAPLFTTLALSVLLGWILLIAGIAGLVMGWRTHNLHRRHMDWLYGGASLIVGIVLLFDPVGGAAALSLILAIWLAVRAGIEFGGAYRTRPGPARRGLVAIGVLDAVLALLLFIYFPIGAIVAIGIVVGVSLLLGGIATIVAALGLRRIEA